jgi:LPS sulfotransferase NodH
MITTVSPTTNDCERALDQDARPRRVMLLGAARTGSNLLLSLLSGHSAIKTYGELFNLDSLPTADLTEALDDPVAYLRKRVYGDQRPETQVVVFKMFYDHLTQDYFDKLVDVSVASEGMQDRFRRLVAFVESNYEAATLLERFKGAWDFLVTDRSLAVIHLRRRNRLDSLISLKTAYLTRRWWSLKSSSATLPAIHVDPDECRRYFDKLETFAEHADAAFEGHERLDVTYEALHERREQVLLKIFEFLKVPYQPVSTRMEKQSTVPASERIDNYAELKRCFEHSKWSVFFE